MRRDPILTEMIAAAERKQKHSRLYRHLLTNYGPLKQAWSENGPNWSEQVKVFAEAGLTDREGNPPTIRTARQTWYRVCKVIRSRSLSPGRSERPSPPPKSGTLRLSETPTTAKDSADPWGKVWEQMDRRSGRLP